MRTNPRVSPRPPLGAKWESDNDDDDDDDDDDDYPALPELSPILTTKTHNLSLNVN